MDKSKVLVMLDNGHGSNTSGKRSPLLSKQLQEKYGIDRLYEYKYVREIVACIKKELEKEGIPYYIVTPELTDISLSTRVKRVNSKYAECKKNGIKAFLISVHLNAASNGQWKNATGWSTWTSIGQTSGDKLADKLYEAAHEILDPKKLKIRTDKSDGDEDWESNFYILKNTNCAATLSESFFMDSEKDVEYLLSDEGKADIVKIHVDGIKKYINSL